MSNDYAAGASAARNKLAEHFRVNGYPVRPSAYGRPPTNEDFLEAVLATVREEGVHFGPGTVMAIFEWWHSRYQVLLPTKLVQDIQKGRRHRYDLFTASSAGGWNTFYLSRAPGGVVKVHRKKHWRKDVEVLNTTFLYAT
jgi:hypothetical protein